MPRLHALLAPGVTQDFQHLPTVQISIWMVKMEWERDESLFIRV